MAYAAALRLTRFHVQNDHGDWDVVHHGFTTANAVHQMVSRNPTPELVPGHLSGGNEGLPGPLPQRPGGPVARSSRPPGTSGRTSPNFTTVSTRKGWWTRRAPSCTAGCGRAAMPPRWSVHSALPFWPRTPSSTGSRPSKRRCARPTLGPLVPSRRRSFSAAAARFLAAHTPTRRELAQVVRIAARLRRGEALYEEI